MALSLMRLGESGTGRSSMSSDGPTLSVGNYVIENAKGGFGIFATDEIGEKTWVATAPDPEVAMKIVEGLILVEMKRFYHPGTDPIFTTEEGNPLPPFLKKGG